MKLLIYLFAGMFVLVSGFFIYVQFNWDRTYDVPLDNDFAVVSSEDAIERGRYLVYGPAHCAYCHTPKERWPELDAGEEVPMEGGYVWETDLGTITSPNLTPHQETGIGSYSDAELKRALRTNVAQSGRAIFPIMEFHQMSDEDLHDIIAFIRSQPEVEHDVPSSSYNLMGRALMSTVLGPVDLGEGAPERSPKEEVTLERGEYIARNVATCMACHTERNPMDGSYTSVPFSGGGPMPSLEDPFTQYAAPNLTPDSKTGVMASWSEDAFVARFKAGSSETASPMPWAAYQRMSETDLRALYRYLQSLDPVENEVERVVHTRQEG